LVRANERIRTALRGIRTSEVQVSYHCRGCKGYYSTNLETRGLGRAACHCGSNDLLLLSIAAEPASPLLRREPQLAYSTEAQRR
jgi:hypothetical protein